MLNLLVFTIVGVAAQLVDGALGMAFGVTSTTLLLFSGVGPAHASAAVHLAEVGTTLVSGVSHWRFRNIDWKVVLRLGVPGAVGAFLGATVLSGLSTKAAAPVTAGILLTIGVYVMLRFSVRPPAVTHARTSPHTTKFLSPLGFFGGFIDASGGGWGPITTSTLLSCGKTAPRTVIGSVSASEFLVALAASTGFLFGLGYESLDNLVIVAGLSLGGMIAAPVAAWLVSLVPATLLGTGVGGVIVLTNAHKLAGAAGLTGGGLAAIYALILAAYVALLTVSWKHSRPTRAEKDGSLEPLTAPTPAARESRYGRPTR